MFSRGSVSGQQACTSARLACCLIMAFLAQGQGQEAYPQPSQPELFLLQVGASRSKVLDVPRANEDFWISSGVQDVEETEETEELGQAADIDSVETADINMTTSENSVEGAELDAAAPNMESAQTAELNATADIKSGEAAAAELNATANLNSSQTAEVNATADTESGEMAELNVTDSAQTAELNATVDTESVEIADLNATVDTESSETAELNATGNSDSSQIVELNATSDTGSAANPDSGTEVQQSWYLPAAETASQQTAEANKTAQQSWEQPAGQAAQQSWEKPAGQAAQQSLEQPIGQGPQHAWEKPAADTAFPKTPEGVEAALRALKASEASEASGLGDDNDKVPFFVYDPALVEPRFYGSLASCKRKGGDYMFLQSLLKHPMRQLDPAQAEVVVIPCLFESYRRCTTTNHAEKPPGSLRQMSIFENRNPDDHPEDFEDIPWMKELDDGSARCLDMIQESKLYKESYGRNHIFVVADWAMNFGKTLESERFKNITVGRIEVIDKIEGAVANRSAGPTQSRCSVVVPYASDIAYVEDFGAPATFNDWMARPHVASFRFEDREYVLYCQSDPCPGAFDSTPLRERSLLLGDRLGNRSAIAMGRVALSQYSQEIHNAKFCLVIRGDTPSSHAFFDAIAANCIPVLVSDRWADVAVPFSHGRNGVAVDGIDITPFTVSFSQDQWMNDMDYVGNELWKIVSNPAVAWRMYAAMQEARPKLLWSMPNSTVADFVLRSTRKCSRSD